MISVASVPPWWILGEDSGFIAHNRPLLNLPATIRYSVVSISYNDADSSSSEILVTQRSLSATGR